MNKRRRLFLQRGLFVLGTAYYVPTHLFADLKLAEQAGAWSQLADMPFPAQEIYPVLYKHSGEPVLVNAGGLSPDQRFTRNVSDQMVYFSLTDNQWSYGRALPEARHHLALVSHQDRLYAISGFARDAQGGWQMRKTVWCIDDIASGDWKTMKPLPVEQSEAVVVSTGKKIHVIGGRSPKSNTNREWSDHIDSDKHWAYDSETDRWEALAPLPEARNSAAGVVMGQSVYVISGRTVAGGNNPRVDVYDLGTDQWKTLAPLPQSTLQKQAPRGQGGLAAAVMNQKIYVFGGEWFNRGGGVYSQVWVFEPEKNQWQDAGVMPTPLHGHGAVSHADSVYILGGAAMPGGNQTTAILYKFTT